MMTFIHDHKSTCLGLIGSGITLISKYLEELGIVAQIVAGLGGIVLMVLAISVKVIDLMIKKKALDKLSKSRGKHGKL